MTGPFVIGVNRGKAVRSGSMHRTNSACGVEVDKVDLDNKLSHRLHKCGSSRNAKSGKVVSSHKQGVNTGGPMALPHKCKIFGFGMALQEDQHE